MDTFESAKQHFLAGLQLLAANDLQGAETQFVRSLEFLPDRVSTLNNLSAIKIKLSQFAEAEALSRKAIALEETSLEAWLNLGTILAATQRTEEALQVYERVLARDGTLIRAWLGRAGALLALKKYEEALQTCERTLALSPYEYEALYIKSRVLKELGREDDSQATYRKFFELRMAAAPVFFTEKRPGQKAVALVVNRDPSFETLKTFDVLSTFCFNYPGQLAQYLNEDIHFAYVFLGEVARPSSRKKIPRPDFLINNHSNADFILADGNLAETSALMDSFGVPVVNHPNKAVLSTRDMSVELLTGTPEVMLPQTARFSALGKPREELVREIEAQFEYPLITRKLAMQQGIGMTRHDSRGGLLEALASGPEDFFVTQFVDSRGENKLYRKIRAAVVGNEIIVVRVDHDEHWNVHGRQTDERVAFYLKNMHLLQEEERICEEPEAKLGKKALQALRAIRERIPLDVFGIDFDVAADGRVVFYEANATMNLFVTARKELTHPLAAEDRLKQAFVRYFMSLVGRGRAVG
ncbi:MAG TPA: tetratricopeptide repeat protein [Verrucomicrobiae bacterium]|nr:tetratricopeptide repeat protein [Verrucomicrobiae bacterium]